METGLRLGWRETEISAHILFQIFTEDKAVNKLCSGEVFLFIFLGGCSPRLSESKNKVQVF